VGDGSHPAVDVENVNIQFLQLLVGMPSSAAKWLVLRELTRLSLRLRWLALCVRFGQSVLSFLNSELPFWLLARGMTQLFLEKRDGQSRMAQFLGTLCSLGVVTDQQLDQVSSLEDVREWDVSLDTVVPAVAPCDEVILFT